MRFTRTSHTGVLLGLALFASVALNALGQAAAPGAPLSTSAAPPISSQQTASPAQQTAAPAQQAVQAEGTGGGNLQQVIVTGSIIPRVGEAAQPVVSLDRNFIEQQGDQTLSDVIQRLPQNVSAFTPFVNAV